MHCLQFSPLACGSVSLAPPLTSHRERKKLATRQAIHQAAIDLVERHGLAGTTVEAISDRAGVAPRTFWAYFSSKEDAVINRDPNLPAALHDALVARPADEDAMAALRAVLEEHVGQRLVDSKQAVRRQHLIRREPPLMAATAASFDRIERAMVSAVAQRLGVDAAVDLLPGLLVMAAGGACRLAQQRWADEQGRRPFAEILAESFVRLGEGLAPLSTGRSTK